jgi:SlyX protein
MTDSNSQSNHDLHRRLSDIESLVTFLQRTIDDLNAVILEQQRRLESQDKELGLLRAAFSTLTDSIVELPRRPEDEKPPHY